MASTCNENPHKNNSYTTYVQADPSNFRAVVQKLTGVDQSAQKLPLSPPPQRTTPFKLHEKRYSCHASSPESKQKNAIAVTTSSRQRSLHGEMVMVSPVSPLELMNYYEEGEGGEEEERVIAEKGFYLHPSSLTTPRGFDPPELLPLFPIHSPRNHSSYFS